MYAVRAYNIKACDRRTKIGVSGHIGIDVGAAGIGVQINMGIFAGIRLRAAAQKIEFGILIGDALGRVLAVTKQDARNGLGTVRGGLVAHVDIMAAGIGVQVIVHNRVALIAQDVLRRAFLIAIGHGNAGNIIERRRVGRRCRQSNARQHGEEHGKSQKPCNRFSQFLLHIVILL